MHCFRKTVVPGVGGMRPLNESPSQFIQRSFVFPSYFSNILSHVQPVTMCQLYLLQQKQVLSKLVANHFIRSYICLIHTATHVLTDNFVTAGTTIASVLYTHVG